MAEFFVFGTVGFWVLTAAVVIAITALEECEQGWAATVCLFTYGVLLQWTGGVNILEYLRHYPIYAIFFGVSYLLVGIMWAVAKWLIYVKGKSQDRDDAFRDYCNEKKFKYTKPFELKAWESFKKDVMDKSKDFYPKNPYTQFVEFLTEPQIKDHKERFIRWLSFWPMSLFYTLLNDAFRKLCHQIYRALSGWLQEIAASIYNRPLPKQQEDEQLASFERADDFPPGTLRK